MRPTPRLTVPATPLFTRAAALAAPALAGLSLLAACTATAPPPAPAPPPPAPVEKAAAAPAPAPETPASRFTRLRERLLDAWIADEPAMGRALGLHEWDGRLADYSPAGLTARWQRLQKERDELAAVDASKLGPDDALDLSILLAQVDLVLFKANELTEWRKRPQFYEELFTVNGYLDRDYAPLVERVKKLLEHEKAALTQVAHARQNLVGPMSKAVLETSIKNFRGFVEYLRADVVKQVAGVGSPELQKELKATNEALAKAADALATHLQKQELPRGDNSHVLGAERYKKLLLVQEGLTVPLAEFKRMGEENLLANKRAYEKLAKTTRPKRPRAEALFGEATQMVEASRKYIVDKQLVTIPTDDKAVIKESPPFMRWNAAFLDAPGPFEPKATTAFYYITLPDPKWSRKEREEYLMPFGILRATTVHEVYPGHFLQNQWIKKAPTRAQKILGAYSFIEGWAHYTEQMMIEEGFGQDPQSRLGQLSDALLRNCRMVVSLGVHAQGMSLKQAERRFMDDCKQDRATARQQAARATFDPGYFAYTLGKIQILQLRDEARKRLGARFSLLKFHDALLSHGSPPVPLIRERVLKDLEAGAAASAPAAAAPVPAPAPAR